MIPQWYITAWRKQAPWQENYQVEQDLIIQRALIALFGDEFIKERLAFPGGTALHKLFLAPTARYSELFIQILYINLQNRHEELRNLSSGDGGRGGLNLHILKNLQIAIPPFPEQQAIAEVLSDTDAWIESLEKLIAKKQLIKQGTMQQLLTPKEDWEVKRLGEVGEIVIGLTYSQYDARDYGTFVLRSSNIQNGKLAFENNVFVEMDLPSRVIVKENDLLICVRNGSKQLIGKCALINKANEGHAFGAFMSIIRSNYNNYIYYYFSSNHIQNQIDENLGTTINQLTNATLKSFDIFLPKSLSEQTRIATILSDMDAEIEALEQKLAKAKQVKQGLMQELLTGRIRLV